MQTERCCPLVSAVIPTHRRPKLVIRAIQSVLQQSYPRIEVVVVIDGVDHQTRNAVEALHHPSVICIETGYHAGPAEARNVGVRAANGIYIGLLDDDDEWPDTKIARQMQIVDEHGLAGREFLVSGRSEYRMEGRSVVTPRTLYQPSDDLAEYLWHRTNPLARPGLIASGSALFPRSLSLRLPFPTEAAHEEVGWWLLCVTREKIPLVMAEEIMLIVHFSPPTATRNQVQNWRASLAWARKYHTYMSDTAFSDMLSSTTAWRAKRQEGIRAVVEVARVMRREGKNRAVHWLTVLGIALVPLGMVDSWRRNRHS
jgi:glycosyltransferase involved in cell wall biosynthesis